MIVNDVKVKRKPFSHPSVRWIIVLVDVQLPFTLPSVGKDVAWAAGILRSSDPSAPLYSRSLFAYYRIRTPGRILRVNYKRTDF